MAERAHTGEHFVQVGVTALRDPATGDFLPAVPLYVKVGAEEVDQQTGLSTGEKALCDNIADLFAERFGEYVRASRKGAERIATEHI